MAIRCPFFPKKYVFANLFIPWCFQRSGAIADCNDVMRGGGVVICMDDASVQGNYDMF